MLPPKKPQHPRKRGPQKDAQHHQKRFRSHEDGQIEQHESESGGARTGKYNLQIPGRPYPYDGLQTTDRESYLRPGDTARGGFIGEDPNIPFIVGRNIGKKPPPVPARSYGGNMGPTNKSREVAGKVSPVWVAHGAGFSRQFCISDGFITPSLLSFNTAIPSTTNYLRVFKLGRVGTFIVGFNSGSLLLKAYDSSNPAAPILIWSFTEIGNAGDPIAYAGNNLWYRAALSSPTRVRFKAHDILTGAIVGTPIDIPYTNISGQGNDPRVICEYSNNQALFGSKRGDPSFTNTNIQDIPIRLYISTGSLTVQKNLTFPGIAFQPIPYQREKDGSGFLRADAVELCNWVLGDTKKLAFFGRGTIVALDITKTDPSIKWTQNNPTDPSVRIFLEANKTGTRVYIYNAHSTDENFSYSTNPVSSPNANWLRLFPGVNGAGTGLGFYDRWQPRVLEGSIGGNLITSRTRLTPRTISATSSSEDIGHQWKRQIRYVNDFAAAPLIDIFRSFPGDLDFTPKFRIVNDYLTAGVVSAADVLTNLGFIESVEIYYPDPDMHHAINEIPTINTVAPTYVNASYDERTMEIISHDGKLKGSPANLPRPAVYLRPNDLVGGAYSVIQQVSIPTSSALTITKVNLGPAKDILWRIRGDGKSTGEAGTTIKSGKIWGRHANYCSTINLAGNYTPTGGSGGFGRLTNMTRIVDGKTVIGGDRILLTAQSDLVRNGLWQVVFAGSGSNGVWDRTDNFRGSVYTGTLVKAMGGNMNSNTTWALSVAGTSVNVGGLGGAQLKFLPFVHSIVGNGNGPLEDWWTGTNNFNGYGRNLWFEASSGLDPYTFPCNNLLVVLTIEEPLGSPQYRSGFCIIRPWMTTVPFSRIGDIVLGDARGQVDKVSTINRTFTGNTITAGSGSFLLGEFWLFVGQSNKVENGLWKVTSVSDTDPVSTSKIITLIRAVASQPVGSAVTSRTDPFGGTTINGWTGLWQLRNIDVDANQPNVPGAEVTNNTDQQQWILVQGHIGPFFSYWSTTNFPNAYTSDAGRNVGCEISEAGDLLLVLGGEFLRSSGTGIGEAGPSGTYTYTIMTKPGREIIPGVSPIFFNPPTYKCIVGDVVIYEHREPVGTTNSERRVLRAYSHKTGLEKWTYTIPIAPDNILLSVFGYNKDIILCIGSTNAQYTVLDSKKGTVKVQTQPFPGFNQGLAAGLGSIFIEQFANEVRRVF